MLFTIIFVGLVSIAGYYFSFLTASGAAAAFVTGCCATAGYGMEGLLLLGIFFASSSIWSKYKHREKEFLKNIHTKGSARDWIQVAANGGIAAAAALAAFVWENPVWLLAYCISIASANADTWASELGTLSKQPPISIRTFKRAATGVSGAISGPGTLAAVFGALLIAVSADALFQLEMPETLIIFTAGVAGMLVDSVIGAFFQASYQCTECGHITENPRHCGRPGRLISGHMLMDNDMVNLLSSLIAVILGISLYKFV
ncbi:DUF92 domain-containing protein [Bacillus sp. T33-2]|nr:DUF92 domain-containing protein [Bacillus sp. T33-2]